MTDCQVGELEGKLEELTKHNSQLTDQLKVANSNLTLSESNFEMLEKIIENGERFTNSTKRTDSIQLNILDQLKKLKSQNVVLSQEKAQLEEEFESLSQALFEEANKMVADARKSYSEVESYNNELIQENKSLKSIIKSLQADSGKRSSNSLPMTIPPPPKPPTSSIQTRSSFAVKARDNEEDLDDLQQSAPIVRPSLDSKPIAAPSDPVPSPPTPPISRLNKVRQSWFSKFKSNKAPDDPFDADQGYGALMSLNVDADDDNDDENNDQEVLIDEDTKDPSNKPEQLTKSPSFPSLSNSNIKSGRTSSFPTIPQLKSFK